MPVRMRGRISPPSESCPQLGSFAYDGELLELQLENAARHFLKDESKNRFDAEKNILREMGKLSKADIDQMEVDDLPSEWRLACQMIVRDEDLLVEY